MTRYRAIYDDPDGHRYGTPTYTWRSAPPGLATLRQLRSTGLRPDGQPVAGQIMWRGIGGDRVAYLYRTDLAKPKRTATPAQRAAIDAALEARQICPTCHIARTYYIPRRYGQCLTCAGITPPAATDRARTRRGVAV